MVETSLEAVALCGASLLSDAFVPVPSPSERDFLNSSPQAEPSVQICRVAQPLLAFAPTEPTVRRYRSGLFRKDLRRVDHCRHAWWITGSGRGKAIRSWREFAQFRQPFCCLLYTS